MRIALVIQRYGAGVAGGAELHARYVAELLAEEHEVEVLTTTARDYLSWSPYYPAGVELVTDHLTVRRFAVERLRDQERFAAAAAAAFALTHNDQDEQRYLEEQGPFAPSLWHHLRKHAEDYDVAVCFSYRYLTCQRAVAASPGRCLLVPTAERDPAVDLRSSRELFQQVGAIAYNSPEEQAMITASAGNHEVPGEVVGIFSMIPEKPEPDRFRNRYGVTGSYLLYVGRIDRNKGCQELFSDFVAWSSETANPHQLLLIGEPVLPIPTDPLIRHLGFLSDEDKFDALAGAVALMMPSRYESLSMVTLEAFALGIPVLVNARCDVLREQVRRANGGLHYADYEEFFEALSLLVGDARLRQVLGRQGQAFYRTNYDRAVIAEKYRRLLNGLSSQHGEAPG